MSLSWMDSDLLPGVHILMCMLNGMYVLVSKEFNVFSC